MQRWLDKFNLRFNRAEISGSLGDLGTFLPLAVGMVRQNGMNLGHILFFAGAMHVASGLAFGIPMPVQPMKSIAAIAIAEGLDSETIMAAGIGAGVVLLVLAVTGLIDRLNTIIPRALVRGIQLAVGLKLLIKGVSLANASGWQLAPDSIYVALLCFGIVLVASTSPRFPTAVVVFMLGIAVLFMGSPETLSGLALGWEWPTFHWPSWDAMAVGFWRGTIPQIPLTVLNSVIAVTALSVDLFPERPLAPRKVALSVAAMNLVACPLGGMPMCHGAGGLAAQYRFGARTGGSVVFLGTIKMALAIVFGGSLLAIFAGYPASVLGVLLAFSGLELASVCRDQTRRADFFVMVFTAGLSIAVNVAVGFVLGWLIALFLRRQRSDLAPTSLRAQAGTEHMKETIREN